MEEHVEYGAIKVIELVGVSQESFDDAAQQAVTRAAKSLHGIKGVEVLRMTAKVDGNRISEFHTTIKLAFVVEDQPAKR